MNRQAQKSLATRQRLLDATIESLVKNGYFGTSTVKVAQGAGVARGTMLHHYPTKDSLVLAALEEVLIRRLDAFSEQLSRLDPRDLKVLMVTLWEALKGPTFHAWLELAVASRTHPPLAEGLRPLMKRFDTRVMRLVETRLPLDLLRPFDLKVAVGIGFSAFNGLALDRLQMSSEEVDAKVMTLIGMLALVLKSQQAQ